MTSPAPSPYQYIPDLAGLLVDAPDDSIISRTLHKDGQVKVVLFAFAAGQSLSEHTAASAAILHILSGEGMIGLAGEIHAARPGTWVYMEPRLPHSVVATTPLTMVLIMLQPPTPTVP